MTTAIYFHPEGYSTRGKKLMGRHAAGESFLKAYLRYTNADQYVVLVEKREHAKVFDEIARRYGQQKPVRVVETTRPEELRYVENVYYPGPGIGQHSWQRSFSGHDQWGLCGITHTTSSAGAMDSIAELITAPVQPWDAVICTSTAVKRHAETILRAQAEYLKERLGIKRIVLPLMPVIPLGIHCEEFESFDRPSARKKLGIGEKDHVVLFVGRLSFHAKAHPLAMYRALELAARKLPADEKIVLVECGWFSNAHIEAAFRDGAEKICPSVRVIRLDGRIAENRGDAWGSADVFCSLSDNIQETFGITPIEAMASGLPVVVSDWDGYKDTVRHGIDGFRIPTVMPAAGYGEDLARRHASGRDSYDLYCGLSCSLVAVDIGVAAEAFTALFRSPELRGKMGEEGRKRARATYDWSVVMKGYQALWEEQTRLRKSGRANLGKVIEHWPARMDPFKGFAHYATRALEESTPLTLASGDTDRLAERADSYLRLGMVNFAGYVLPSTDFVRQVISQLARDGTETAGALAIAAGPGASGDEFRALAWMLKVGVLKLAG